MTPTWILSRPLVQRTDGPDNGRIWALGITALYVVASLIYGLLSDAPWDDDCVVRYFNAREVWSKPDHFFSLWNRPLFMVLFAPTAWMGKTAMMVEMIAISALAGWLLYRSLHRLGARDAHWVLPFFFFQTFYFSVSRNFLTEPLAVAVICLGLHAVVHQRYTLFALMGGLLPLARLELVAILPLWGLVLLQARQWKSVVWMGLPVLLLMVLGYFVKDTDNLLWLVDETLGKEGKNRYGYRDVWHYFHRFGYVVGPVVFFFLTIGVLERLARLRIDLFVSLQGAAILLLYVIFSWKLDMGNSAGFLRNLIPLTPFVALLAFDGLQAWQGVVAKDTGARQHAAVPVAEQAREDRKRQKKAAAKNPVKKADRPANPWWGLGRVQLFGAIAVAVLAVYFHKELQSHHKISELIDYTPAYVAGALAVIGWVLLLAFRTRPTPPWVLAATGVLVSAGALAYTLHTERPNAHLNHERKAISTLSTLYADSYLREWPLYANHTWFFWPTDLGYPDRSKYRVLNKAALDTAEAHSVVLWENHYSHRLQGNVQLADMYKRTDMVELCHVVGRDHRTNVGLFQKIDTALKDGDALRERFNKAYPDNLYALYAANLYHGQRNQHTEALAAAQRMVALDSTYAEAVLAEGQAYFALGKYDEAIARYQKILKMDTALFSVHYSIATCHLRKQEYTLAVESIKLYQTRDKKLKEAWEVLGASYYYLKDYDKSIAAFGDYIKLNGKAVGGWLNRASAYVQQNKLDMALADYEVVLRLEPNNRTALLNKSVILIRQGRKDEGCNILQQMAAAGDPAAAQQVMMSCR